MTRGRRSRVVTPALEAPDLMTSRLRLLGLGLLGAKVMLVPVVFDYAADLPFTVMKGVVSHALAYALAGVLLGLSLQFGRAFLVWSWLHIPVVAFLVANAAAALFAEDSVLALYGARGRMLGLGTIADWVVLYFSVALLVRARREAVVLLLAALAASAAVLAYELVQFLGKDPFDWNVDSAVRPFSTLGQTTTLAEYLTVIALGAMSFGLFDVKLSSTVRGALLGYSGILMAGVVATQTRSAVIGVVAGVAALVVLTWFRHPNPKARVSSVIGVGVATSAFALLVLLTPLGARVLSTVELPAIDVTGAEGAPRVEQSVETRVGLYAAALAMVRDRPLVGYGPDNFSAAFPTYRTESEPSEIQQSLPTSAHGWLSHVAATSGFLGLAAFVGIAGAAVFLAFKAGSHPVTWAASAMLLAFLGAGLTTVSDLGTDWLFWASAGAIAAVTAQPRTPQPSLGRAVRRGRQIDRSVGPGWKLRNAAVIVAAGVGLTLVLTGVNALAAARSSRDSQQHRLVGRPQQAVDSALRATSLDPRRAEYWDRLGLAYVSYQRLTDAVSAFSQAANRARYDARYLGDLASAYLLLKQSGDVSAGAKARDVATRGVQADPNNPRANLNRAIVMQVTGDMSEALRSVELALTLDPKSTNPQLFLTATQVLYATGRTNDAIAMARRAISALSNPQDTVQIRVELARALVANGQPTLALAELDSALAIRPNDPVALQLRTQIRQALPQ